MESIIVDISVPAEEYLKRYRYPGAMIATRSRDGRRVRFPANILQRFVTHTGISGSFEIHFDQQGKFLSIKRLT